MSEIILQHRTIADLTKPQPPIPTGVWKFQASKLSAKQVTKQVKNDDGEMEDREATEYLLVVQPIEPTSTVDRDALKAVDERTGRPLYDGKRLFLRFVDLYYGDKLNFGQCLQAMGFDGNDDLGEIVERNLVKGRTAYGEVWNREFERRDGTPGTDQRVRQWSAKGGSESFAI